VIKVSIIVPVYKTAMYLRRCLDSCIYQTLHEIEVIVVNDASPAPEDAVIMREYELTYPNIVKCLYLSENLHQGGARNKGMKVAIGEYVLFVDSDDYIDFTMCEKLYKKAIDNDSDLVYCDFYLCLYGQNSVWAQSISGEENKHEYLINNFDKFIMSTCLCIIRREYIISNRIYFPEHIYYEDNVVAPLLYIGARNVRKVDLPLYFYMKNNTSTTATPTAEKMFMYIDTISLLIDLSKKNEVYDSFRFELHIIILYHLSNFALFVYEKIEALFQEWCTRARNVLEIDLSVFDKFNTRKVQQMKSFAEFLLNVSENAVLEFKLYSRRNLKDRFLELYNILPSNRICIWGVGIRGTSLSNIIALTDIIVNYTDISTAVHGKIMPDSRRVVPCETVKNSTDVIIICTSSHYESVRNMVGNKYLIIDYEKYLSEDCSADRFIKNVVEGEKNEI